MASLEVRAVHRDVHEVERHRDLRHCLQPAGLPLPPPRRRRRAEHRQAREARQHDAADHDGVHRAKDSACSRRPSRTPGDRARATLPFRGHAQHPRGAPSRPGPRRPPDARADRPAAARARPRADRRSRRRTRSSTASATCSSTRCRSPARAATRSCCCRASKGSTRRWARSCCGPARRSSSTGATRRAGSRSSLYPAFEFRRREFRTHPWWGDLVRRAPEASRRSCCAHPRRGAAALVGDGGPRQQGLVGPRASPSAWPPRCGRAASSPSASGATSSAPTTWPSA